MLERELSPNICSPEDMIAAIRHYGFIPLFKCGIPLWSIEELTPPEHWFYTSDELGPWDWKIDAVREEDIIYGKFLGGQAAFATSEFYAHLMNYRRSLPKYRVALGEKFPSKTRNEKLLKALSPAALTFIRENGTANSSEIREALSKAVTPSMIRTLGASYKTKLTPSVKKSICDIVMQFLEMGTWTVVGDITRVFRGPNAVYSGWQRSTHTTPDAMFSIGDRQSNPEADSVHKITNNDAPFWAKFIEPEPEESSNSMEVDCTPEESRKLLIHHIREFFPEADEKVLMKIV